MSLVLDEMTSPIEPNAIENEGAREVAAEKLLYKAAAGGVRATSP